MEKIAHCTDFLPWDKIGKAPAIISTGCRKKPLRSDIDTLIKVAALDLLTLRSPNISITPWRGFRPGAEPITPEIVASTLAWDFDALDQSWHVRAEINPNRTLQRQTLEIRRFQRST
ncbi:hypothetical protein HFN63_35235 [Rhizobium leguminosarum]|uniref:hypothetical protein n=1 Tax=Rhizobium leguminosarum TaxID=384 RepID=UPI001C93E7C5|nr:hypothetical protein [Rhizobium leguminosarum]MBY5775228.1 hypothetical protein [Rhizobium leguminosarum]